MKPADNIVVITSKYFKLEFKLESVELKIVPFVFVNYKNDFKKSSCVSKI